MGKTDQELLSRLEKERFEFRTQNLRIINYTTAIGTFRTLEDANTLVNDALRANVSTVNSVARRDSLVEIINYRVGSVIGVEAYRPSGDQPSYIRPAFEVRIVLWHLPNAPSGFGIRTAFPVNPLSRC